MKSTKLIIGILSIVLSLFVLLQSCSVNVVENLTDDDTASGGFGILIAFFMLTAGIIAICTRNGKIGGIIAGWVFFFGGIVGRAGADTTDFADLEVWSWLCFIFACIFVFGSVLFMRNKKTDDTSNIKNAKRKSLTTDQREATQNMTDEQFEYYCEYLLKMRYYFTRTTIPVKTSDRKCDIIAYRKDGTAWVLFCQQDASKIDNEMIDKLVSAKRENRAQYMAIMTASHVSNGVRILAKEKDIQLFEDLRGVIDND